jgi:hypothetical protein
MSETAAQDGTGEIQIIGRAAGKGLRWSLVGVVISKVASFASGSSSSAC